MTEKPKTARAVVDRLTDALVEDILNASDEDALAEFKEGGGDPERHAADMRALFEKRLIAAHKKRLAAAKAGAAASRRSAGIAAPAIDIATVRARLRAALGAPGFPHKLTLAARKESELSDADILSMLDDLRELGVLPPEDNEGGSA